MADLEEIVFQLTAETSQLKAELSKATKVTADSATKMEQALKEFSANSSSNVGIFQDAIGTMAGFLASNAVLGAVNVLKSAFGFLSDQLKAGVTDAAAEEQGLVRLANALALSGQYSTEAMKGLEGFIDEMERSTGIDDAVIAGNLALLSSLTKLSASGLKAAEKAAIDLSAALGIDVDSAVRLVGKGITGNTDAFKRYGITIQEGATKAENLNNILKALAGTNGSAAGLTETYSGALKLLNVAYDNFLKVIAKWITQNPVVIAMIKATTVEISQLSSASDDSLEPMQAVAITMITIVTAAKLVLEAVGNVIQALKLFEVGLETIDVAISTVVDVVQGMIDTFTGLVTGIYAVVTGNKELADSMDKTADSFGRVKWDETEKAVNRLSDTVHSKIPFSGLVGSLDNIADKGAEAFYKIQTAAAVTAPTVKGVAAAVAELTRTQTLYNAVSVEFAKGLADQNNALLTSVQQETDVLDAQHEAKLVSESDYWAARQSLIAEQQGIEEQALSDSYQRNLISAGQYLDAKTQLELNHTAQNKKFQAEYTKWEDSNNKTRLGNLSGIFGQIATLSDSKNKELAAIGKAAAIAQATVDGYLAVNNALATIPYPYNFIAAGLVGVAAAANVAKIAGVGFNKGTNSVPGVGNTDSVPAMLTPGERVLTAEQNKDLTSYLKRQQGGQGITVHISFDGATLVGAPPAEFGAMVVEAINDAATRGQTTGLVKGAISA